MAEKDCVFCSPEGARVFYEGARVLGLWDAFPVAPGHALLVTRRHVATWFDASVEEQRDLTSAISIAQRAILEAHEPDGFNIGVNVGDAGGQTVPHLHVHVIPRFRGDVDDPRGGVRGVVPGKRLYDVAGGSTPLVDDQPAAYSAGSSPALWASNRTAEAAAFSERIIQLLDQGRFTATYKFAVLLGLMDACLQRTSETGAAPASVSTRDLAERVLELYWPHTVPFSAEQGGVGHVLSQNAGGQAEIVSTIARFRDRVGGDRSVPLGAAKRAAGGRYEKLIDQIEWKLIEMPLPRLQLIGDQKTEFLYRVGWDRSVKRRDVESGAIDRAVYFVGGAGEHLVQLAGILRPLIERQWVSMIAGLNRNVTGELVLQEFLFGADRISLEPVRGRLRELQSNRCFYCEEKLRAAPDVDHFLPWARYPDNGIDNLVVADQGCNNRKRDFLASAQHVENWSARLERRATDLAAISEIAGWDRHPDRTVGVARAIYLRLPADVKLWDLGTNFAEVGAQSDRLRKALASGVAA